MKTHERYKIVGDMYAFDTSDLGMSIAIKFNEPITQIYIANRVFDDEICAEEDWLLEWELLGFVMWGLYETL